LVDIVIADKYLHVKSRSFGFADPAEITFPGQSNDVRSARHLAIGVADNQITLSKSSGVAGFAAKIPVFAGRDTRRWPV